MNNKIVILFLFLFSYCSAAELLTGKVVGVSDGDTITVLSADKQQTKLRLYGIDCPEKSQAYGQKAKQYTSDLVFGKEVAYEVIDTDRYGRSVALVRTGDTILNLELVKAGLAWNYAQYCKREPLCRNIKQAEENSRSAKIGLWSEPNPIPPWDFRHGGKRW